MRRCFRSCYSGWPRASARVFDIGRLYASRNITAPRTPLPEDVDNPLATALMPNFRRQLRQFVVVAGTCVVLIGVLLAAALILQHLPAR